MQFLRDPANEANALLMCSVWSIVASVNLPRVYVTSCHFVSIACSANCLGSPHSTGNYIFDSLFSIQAVVVNYSVALFMYTHFAKSGNECMNECIEKVLAECLLFICVLCGFQRFGTWPIGGVNYCSVFDSICIRSIKLTAVQLVTLCPMGAIFSSFATGRFSPRCMF